MATHIERFENTVQLDSGLIIPASAAVGKVLTSDASGNATWSYSSWKIPVAWATTAALPTVTAEGELLKSTGKEALKVDSGTPAVAARVLIKNQAASKDNGIYEVVKKGAAGTEIFELKRTADANTKPSLQGATVGVENGAANEASIFEQTSTVTTVGTSSQTWQSCGAGQWTAIALGAKAEAGPLQVPASRAENNGAVGRLRGSPKAKEEIKPGETIATVSVGLRPSVKVDLIASHSTEGGTEGGMIIVSIATTGIITGFVALPLTHLIFLDGLTYNIT